MAHVGHIFLVRHVAAGVHHLEERHVRILEEFLATTEARERGGAVSLFCERNGVARVRHGGAQDLRYLVGQ